MTTERVVFDWIVWAWLATAAIVFVALFWIDAPYGKLARRGIGAEIPSSLGWILMEAPAPILMALFFTLGDRQDNLPALAFLAMWELHYVNRAFVFPLRRRGGEKPIALAIVSGSVIFNVGNGYLNGRGLFSFGPLRGPEWLADPRFVAGVLLFLGGFLVNLHGDAVLRRLRAPGETGYKIPYGGLYRFISCPNYFGEMLEWSGFALATWSLPALSFAIWTVANLAPRAISTHRWYQEKFPEYPRSRRALIPFVL